MKKNILFQQQNGANLKVGIAVARWNSKLTGALLMQCKQAFRDAGVDEDRVIIQEVPGSYELPYAAAFLIDTYAVDVVVCIGVLIKGETMHFEYIADAVSHGLMMLQLDRGVPVIFGVLTCLDEAQAHHRSLGEGGHGYAWGQSGVEMGLLYNQK